MLTLSLNNCCSGPLAGVSYCCDSGLLLVSSGNRLLKIDQEDGMVCLLREERKDALILSVVCLSPYAACCVLRGSKVYFVLISCNGEPLSEETMPDSCKVDAMLLEPCGCTPGKCGLLLLTNQHSCSPYLLQMPLEESICQGLCPCNK